MEYFYVYDENGNILGGGKTEEIAKERMLEKAEQILTLENKEIVVTITTPDKDFTNENSVTFKLLSENNIIIEQ